MGERLFIPQPLADPPLRILRDPLFRDPVLTAPRQSDGLVRLDRVSPRTRHYGVLVCGLKDGRSPEDYAQTRLNHFTFTRQRSGLLSTSAVALVRIGNRRLRGRASDRPIVDGPLIDTSLRISTATIAHKVTLRITLICNAILRQRRTAARHDANDRQFQFHGASSSAA